MSLGLVTGKLLRSLSDVIFPCFFMFFEVSWCRLHICSSNTSSSLHWLPSGGKYLSSALIGTQAFPGLQWIHLLHSWFLLWQNSEASVPSLDSAGPDCMRQPSFYFSEGGLSQAHRSVCTFTSHLRKLSIASLGSVHGKLATGSEGRCVGEMCEVLGVSVGWRGRSVGEAFPVLMGGPPTRAHDMVSKTHVSLKYCEPWLLSPSLSLTPIHSAQTRYSWWGKREVGLLAAFSQNGFPHSWAAPKFQPHPTAPTEAYCGWVPGCHCWRSDMIGPHLHCPSCWCHSLTTVNFKILSLLQWKFCTF